MPAVNLLRLLLPSTPQPTLLCLLPALSSATQLEVDSLKQRLVAADMALTTVQKSHTEAVGQAATAQVCAPVQFFLRLIGQLYNFGPFWLTLRLI